MAKVAKERDRKEETTEDSRENSGCLSCGLPLDRKSRKSVADIDDICSRCTDSEGHLKSYTEVHESLVNDYFMKKQKMDRTDADRAATNQMKKVPAWKNE